VGSARPDPGVAHGTKWAFGVQGPAMSGTRFVNKSTSNEPVGEPSPSRSDPLALPVGTRIGAYTVEAALGSGGFGITYRVRHDTLNKQFALKEYFPRQFSYRDKANVQSTASSGKEYLRLGARPLHQGGSGTRKIQAPGNCRCIRHLRGKQYGLHGAELRGGSEPQRVARRTGKTSHTERARPHCRTVARCTRARSQPRHASSGYRARQRPRARRLLSGADRFRRGARRSQASCRSSNSGRQARLLAARAV